jgi:hypothetical protein
MAYVEWTPGDEKRLWQIVDCLRDAAVSNSHYHRLKALFDASRKLLALIDEVVMRGF